MRRQRTTQPIRLSVPPEVTPALIARLKALPSSLKGDYLKAVFLSKYVDESTDPADVRRTRAINKWLATERNNEATNERLLITPEEYNILPRVTFNRFVSSCRRLVQRLIGEVPPVDALIGSFSGGASTSRARTESHPAGKYLGIADVTGPALALFYDSVIEEIPGWPLYRDDFNVVPGNVLFTVPKKSDIDRCACKEPDINMWMQKGIGDFFRSRLRKRASIDLNDQSRNRDLARLGSLTGSLATLDLASASDSVTRGFVELLLPPCWFTLLDSVRSPVTVIDGEIHRNEMFSSMGNGFTFELESLLFFTLATVTAEFLDIPGVISVYGDDIIVPTALSRDLEWILGYFGFEVNTSKSFSSGPFRESCGGHYSDGVDITPFYLRGPIKTMAELIDVANKLRQWAQIPGLSILDPSVEPIWLWLAGFIPRELWGGDDLTSQSRLVAPVLGSHRIVTAQRRRDSLLGGYYHWLNATWARDRLRDAVLTSTFSTSTTSDTRVRKVRFPRVTSLPAVFLSELDH